MRIARDSELMPLRRPCTSKKSLTPQRYEHDELLARNCLLRPASLQQPSPSPPRSDDIRQSSEGSGADLEERRSISLSSSYLLDDFANNVVPDGENYVLDEEASIDFMRSQGRSLDRGGENRKIPGDVNDEENENDKFGAVQDNRDCSFSGKSLCPRSFRPLRAAVPFASNSDRPLSILDKIINEQTDRLGVRNDPKLWDARGVQRATTGRGRNSRMELSSGSESESDDLEDPAIRRWARYLKSLPNDFFTAKGARMEIEGDRVVDAAEAAHGRCSPYAGLLLRHSPLNCPDMLCCFEQCYEIKIRRGGRTDASHQFKAAAGQLARFSVAAEVATAESFGKPGGLFDLVRQSRLIGSPLNFFAS
jgi:hypothetical protein